MGLDLGGAGGVLAPGQQAAGGGSSKCHSHSLWKAKVTLFGLAKGAMSMQRVQPTATPFARMNGVTSH